MKKRATELPQFTATYCFPNPGFNGESGLEGEADLGNRNTIPTLLASEVGVGRCPGTIVSTGFFVSP